MNNLQRKKPLNLSQLHPETRQTQWEWMKGIWMDRNGDDHGVCENCGRIIHLGFVVRENFFHTNPSDIWGESNIGILCYRPYVDGEIIDGCKELWEANKIDEFNSRNNG